MTFTVIVSAITGILVFVSVLVKPHITIGKIQIGTYWVISCLGALILIISRSVPLKYLLSELNSEAQINPIKILILFFTMTSLSIFLDEVGFFRYLANLAIKKTGKNQIKLFIIIYALVSILTIFTSNDIVILTFTPFICFFAKEAHINPIPYLFGEFVGANTWSMFLIIGNPTNIYIASFANIDFMSYVFRMFLPTCSAGITSLFLLLLVFRRQLKKEMETTDVEDVVIEDKFALRVGVVLLAACTILLAISSYLKLEMYLITAGFAISLFLIIFISNLVRHKKHTYLVSTVKRLPYELIPFVLSMFVLVISLSYCGVTSVISEMLVKGDPTYKVGFASFFAANVINNIPMSVLFSSIINASNTAQNMYQVSVYSAIIGSNLGAFFTPVGALAGIMWLSILGKNGIKFSFRNFVTDGAVISIPTMMVALSVLHLEFL